MGWSTRELAELAGISLRTVRHYHNIGLLAEPDRRSNGYKSYGVAHLVRVLRIKRFAELGLSLAQIGEMDEAGAQPQDALRVLDAEIADTIDRLLRVRSELAGILSNEVAADLPPEFAWAAAKMEFSDTDRALAFVLSRLLGPAGLQAFTVMFQNYHDRTLDRELERLPADADERMRDELAKRMVAQTRKLSPEHTDILTSTADAPRGEQFAQRTIVEAMLEIYNSAQIDVLVRVSRELSSPPDSRHF